MVNTQHHKRLWSSTFIVFIVILSVVSVGRVGAQQQSAVIPNQTAQNGGSEISCGQTVQGNVTLTANLNCNGDGLIVGDDATTINLNGFGIYGPGADNSKVGIGITEDNVVINGPGIIRGFEAGVLLTGALPGARCSPTGCRSPSAPISRSRARTRSTASTPP